MSEACLSLVHCFVVQFYGLGLPNVIKMEIKDNPIYLVPGNFEFLKIEWEDTYNFIKKINNTSNYGLFQFPTPNFRKRKSAFFYLVIRDYEEDIISKILQLLQFIFSINIQVKKVFEINNSLVEREWIFNTDESFRWSPNKSLMVSSHNMDILEYIGNFFSILTKKAIEEEQFFHFIKDLNQIDNSNEINIICSGLWDFLEHLVSYYAKKRDFHLLIDSNKFHKLKKKISRLLKKTLEEEREDTNILRSTSDSIASRVLNEIDNRFGLSKNRRKTIKKSLKPELLKVLKSQDILNPIYDEGDVIQKIFEGINFFPRIKFKIELTYKELYNKKINSKLKETIDLFYKVRNDIYHDGVDFYEQSEEVRHRIAKRLLNFRKFVLNLLLRLFGLQEHIDNENKVKIDLSLFLDRNIIKEQFKYFSYLMNKYEIFNPILQKVKNFDGITTNYLFNYKINGFYKNELVPYIIERDFFGYIIPTEPSLINTFGLELNHKIIRLEFLLDSINLRGFIKFFFISKEGISFSKRKRDIIVKRIMIERIHN